MTFRTRQVGEMGYVYEPLACSVTVDWGRWGLDTARLAWRAQQGLSYVRRYGWLLVRWIIEDPWLMRRRDQKRLKALRESKRPTEIQRCQLASDRVLER
jgi:hypothetical protein